MITVEVPGMRCRHCVRTVTARLRDLPGVLAIVADAATATLVVQGDVTEEQVRAALVGVTFLPSPGCPGRERPLD